MSSCLVIFLSVVLNILSVHFRCRILRRRTFELNILSLVLVLICFALQMFLNMMNATLAFGILALTSSSVPPCLWIVLPRYVNESVSSSGSPFIVMGLLFLVLAFVILVLLLLMLSPSCVDTVFSSSAFVDGCVGGERGHPQSTGPPTGSHFFYLL